MAKRLRGWQMEMESGRQKTSKPSVLEKTQQALEKATKPQSGLASRLLHLWATGVLSAIMVRELAQLALSDGADHAELIKLAECANWGATQGTHTDRSWESSVLMWWLQNHSAPKWNALTLKLPWKRKSRFHSFFHTFNLHTWQNTTPCSSRKLLALEKATWKSFGQVWN